MLSKVCSAAVSGIEAYPVEVEVNAGYGDTVLVIVVNKTPKRGFGLMIRPHLAAIHLALGKGLNPPKLAA